MATAKVGDRISFSLEKSKFEGIVSGIRENSVIVEYGYSDKKDAPLRTIINHKHYKIIKKA